MKFTTKTGRKVVGALVSAAVMVSMIPAMVFAGTAPQTKTVTITLDSIEGTSTSYADKGIIISASRDGKFSSSGLYIGTNQKTCNYSIAIDGAEGAVYAGGFIRSVTITTGNNTAPSQTISISGDIVKNPVVKTGDTLTWTGNSKGVSFRVNYSGLPSVDHYLPVTSIAVEVEVPATGISIISPTFPLPIIPDFSIQAYAQFLPANTTYTSGIVWSIDDESVATVTADGVITPVGAGTATLTASYAGLSDSVEIECYDFREGVIFIPSEVSIIVDSAPVTLNYVLGSDMADHDLEFIWVSGDEDVATVEDGVVTPVGVGSTIIDLIVIDNTAQKIHEAQCTVNVSFYSEAELTQMSVSNFVGTLYTRILHREFDAAGRDSWMSLLMEQGGTATTVAIGFFESPEYTSYNTSNEEFVTTLYWVMCNRAGTEAEIADWVAKLDGGATRDSVIREFAASQEWANLCAFFRVNV
jgi:hypothetical protein